MTPRTGRTSALASAALVLLVGCGPATTSAVGGDEPTTARALAFVAAEHAGVPSSARVGEEIEEFTDGGTSAELRYNSDGEYDGDMLGVAVGTGLDPALVDCEGESFSDECVVTDRGTLLWEEVAPESDPGVIAVLTRKEGTAVLVVHTGPEVTGDPRELDLEIPVDTLFDIAEDPRVDVTTSAATVEAGADLPYWRD